MSEQWMSIVEYARTFNTSDMTIRRRIKSGRIKAMLRDGKYYIPVQTAANGQLMPVTKAPAIPAAAPYTIAAMPSAAPVQAPASAIMPVQMVKAPTVGVAATPPVSQMPAVENTATYNKVMAANAAQTAADQMLTQSALSSLSVSIEKTYLELKMLTDSNRSVAQKFAEAEARFKIELATQLSLKDEIIKNKDLQINELKQKIEDLQLLTQILEKTAQTT